MKPKKLRYAQCLMADQRRSIPAICRELGDMATSTLYHYLHVDGSLKAPDRELLGTQSQTDQADKEDPKGSPNEAAGLNLRRARALV